MKSEVTVGIIIFALGAAMAAPAMYRHTEAINNPTEIRLTTVTYADTTGETVTLDDVVKVDDGSGWFKGSGNITLQLLDGTIVNIGDGTPYTASDRVAPNPNYTK